MRTTRRAKKVVGFLSTHVFGPERVAALKASLAEIGPEADNAHAEVERLRAELVDVQKWIPKSQEPSSEDAADIRSRFEELGAIRSKKERLESSRAAP